MRQRIKQITMALLLAADMFAGALGQVMPVSAEDQDTGQRLSEECYKNYGGVYKGGIGCTKGTTTKVTTVSDPKECSGATSYNPPPDNNYTCTVTTYNVLWGTDGPTADDIRNNNNQNPSNSGKEDTGTGTGTGPGSGQIGNTKYADTSGDDGYSYNEAMKGVEDKLSVSVLDCNQTDGSGIFCILNIALTVLTYGVGIAGTLGIVISGVQYLTARDSAEQMTKAKSRIVNIIIGLVLYAVMWAFLQWLIPGGILNS